MATSLRELVLNETRAYSVFANGRIRDHRFAISLICDELPDLRFNRSFILEADVLTPESLEEIARDFILIRLPLRLDIFLPITAEVRSFLERKGFELTEDYAAEMVLAKPDIRLRGNPAVEIETLTERFTDAFSTILVKAFDAPSDLVPTLVSIFRNTIPHALEHRGVTLYLAFLGAKPVGTLYLFSQGGVAGLYNLTVAHSARRQGVATTLLLRGIEDSKTLGDTTLCVQTRLGSFQEKFFERLGFETVARRKRAIRPQS